MSDWIDYFAAIIGAILIALIIWLSYAIFKVATDNKVCAVGHYEKRNGLILVGKVTVPTQYDSYVCDVWEQQ